MYMNVIDLGGSIGGLLNANFSPISNFKVADEIYILCIPIYQLQNITSKYLFKLVPIVHEILIIGRVVNNYQSKWNSYL